MAGEEELDVAAGNLAAPVLSPTAIFGIDEQKYKRGKILRQRREFRELAR